jgi:predicted nucleotidyltransferase
MPDPVVVPGFDLSRWEKALEDEAGRREAQRLQVLSQAREKIAAYFQGRRVRAVYLTGSLTRAGQFYDFSDVDIAVAGLEEDYFAALAALEDLLDRQVELIELESCPFGGVIREKGIRIV